MPAERKNKPKKKEKKMVFRHCRVVDLPRSASTHLLLWAVDDDQVGSASDAVPSAILPVHFEGGVLSKRK